MNEFLSQMLWGNELWRWMSAGALVAGAYLLARLLAWVLSRHSSAQGRGGVAWRLLANLKGPIVLASLSGAMYAIGFLLRYSLQDGGQCGWAELSTWGLWSKCNQTLGVLVAVWVLFKALDAIEHTLRHGTAPGMGSALNTQLLPFIRKALRVVVFILAGLFLANNVLNWDVAALLAGLGLGGLAFALAARDMLANLFGTVTIFGDQPFKLGDRVATKGFEGVVDDVGFRSTRIRTSSGEVVVIPNSVLTNEVVVNISSRGAIFHTFEVPLPSADVPAVRAAMAAARELLAARAASFLPGQPPRVSLSRLDSAAAIVITWWFIPPEPVRHWEFLDEFRLELAARLKK